MILGSSDSASSVLWIIFEEHVVLLMRNMRDFNHKFMASK